MWKPKGFRVYLILESYSRLKSSDKYNLLLLNTIKAYWKLSSDEQPQDYTISNTNPTFLQ